VGDTLIKTNKGDIKITDIVDNKEEYTVLTYNIENGLVEEEKILFADKTRKMSEVIKIELEDGEILKLTPDHKVYTENRGYVEAAKLNNDDIIICLE
jgi:ribonucleoside-diphosphate reductase alpha chain